MARIVRNNRIFENNQSEWNSNIHIMSTPVKFVRLYAVCRYIKMLIEENECPGLVSVDVVLNGKGFTKGSIENKDIKLHQENGVLTLNTSDGDNDNGDNKTIKSKSFTENKHKNHTDKDLILLTTSTNTY